ncbi:endonuclease SmrB [Shewanella sp. 10N.261.52.F9]|uniref:Ribosome rescue factor SmrB n=1 Tax=Shewanella sairae TaxID=190310 RepID=A0ABQ4PQC8_9GAMM|nr:MULTISPECIES: endonuclease SmrB [Shewanella]MCL1132205.1 endonuclease SmrB [Shewanella sairae]MCL1147704.1 endonuclease SmrB [Shewanella marinintestina]GIU51098.1 UPF0115 protein [Shewanella sairae]
MNKSKDNDELALFAELTKGITPLQQNKRHFIAAPKDRKIIEEKEQQLHADSYFSDTYQPLLPVDGPMKWVRDDVDSYDVKRLRRGDYVPDLLLDMHGMRQTEAKLELAALIQACIKQQSHCCCVMHGHGTGILKQNIPMWLAQHPHVKAFHQATKEWGGDAALLVLIDIGDQPYRR